MQILCVVKATVGQKEPVSIATKRRSTPPPPFGGVWPYARASPSWCVLVVVVHTLFVTLPMHDTIYPPPHKVRRAGRGEETRHKSECRAEREDTPLLAVASVLLSLSKGSGRSSAIGLAVAGRRERRENKGRGGGVVTQAERTAEKQTKN